MLPSYRPHSLEYKFYSQHKGSSTGVIVVQYAQWVRNWTHNSQVWGFQQWTLNPKPSTKSTAKMIGFYQVILHLKWMYSKQKPEMIIPLLLFFNSFFFFFYVLEVSCKGRNVWSKEIKSKTPLIKHQIPLWYKIFSICRLLFVLPMI